MKGIIGRDSEVQRGPKQRGSKLYKITENKGALLCCRQRRTHPLGGMIHTTVLTWH